MGTMNRDKPLESRDARRERVTYWAEHYKRELGVPQVVFTTTQRELRANGVRRRPAHVVPSGTAELHSGGKLISTFRTYSHVDGLACLDRPLCWIRIERVRVNDQQIEDLVLHEMLHAVYRIDDGPAFKRMLRISRRHPRTKRNLDRLARAALQMQTGLISSSYRAD